MQVRSQQSVNRDACGIFTMNGSGSVVGLVHLRARSAFDPAGAPVVIRGNHQKGGPANDDNSPDQRDYEMRETLCSM